MKRSAAAANLPEKAGEGQNAELAQVAQNVNQAAELLKSAKKRLVLQGSSAGGASASIDPLVDHLDAITASLQNVALEIEQGAQEEEQPPEFGGKRKTRKSRKSKKSRKSRKTKKNRFQ